jgi:hypothetical protein
MSELRIRWSFSFALALSLLVVSLICLARWKDLALLLGGSTPEGCCLTPWLFLFVATLSFSLALNAVPLQNVSPVRTILSKTLAVCVLCITAVFLVERVSGIHVPELGSFFLADGAGRQSGLHSSRPSPHCAFTSLLFAGASLIYSREAKWRLHAFRFGTVAALVLPLLAGLSYAGRILFGISNGSWITEGLSIPAVILYCMLASGFLRLSHGAVPPRPQISGSTGAFFRRI